MNIALSDQLIRVPLENLDERLSRYRLRSQQSEQRMASSLQRYGQIAPLVACPHEDVLLLIDGFKRLRAARQLTGMTTLSVQRLEVDQVGAKAAIYNLNLHAARPHEMEEAWIVYALVREDGLSQVEAAQLLGRHKSWVNRRLALLERLAPAALEQLRLGLLTVSLARQLVRLPVGNQTEALDMAREASLTSVELRGAVDLLLASSTEEQKQFVLADPRRALRQASDTFLHVWDPRLSAAGNRAAKQLGHLLDQLARMHSWLRYSGRSSLVACDRQPLLPGFERLVHEARQVAEATNDLVQELRLP